MDDDDDDEQELTEQTLHLVTFGVSWDGGYSADRRLPTFARLKSLEGLNANQTTTRI